MKCGFFQSWIGDGYDGHGYLRAIAACRKCGKRNQFNPKSRRWTGGQRRGRTAGVWFHERPAWMPRHALNQEAISRNLHAKEGVTMEEYIPAFHNALTSKETVRQHNQE